MKRVLLVTGSGRSGTSSVAGALKRLGLHIPQPEVEADHRNPRGYYEPQWVARFHGSFLNGIPVRTIDTRPDAGRIAMEAVTTVLEAELRDWLSAELAALPDETVVAVKETRALWLFPLWQRVTAEAGGSMMCLTMLRHPTQVVRSRDSAYLSGQPDSLRLQRETTNVAAWMNSVFETERASREHPRAFVPYHDLIGDWRGAMSRAAGQLDIEIGDLTAPHPVDDFLTASLNRSSDRWEGLRVPDRIKQLADRTWDAANQVVAEPHDPDARGRLDALREEYVELYDASAAIAADEVAAQVQAVKRRLGDRLAVKNERLEKLRRELRAARGETT